MSDRLRIGVGLLVVAAAVVLFVVLQGVDTSNDSGKEKLNGKTVNGVPTIHLQGGQPVGGVQDLEVNGGERLRFRVTSDIEGEVHVHGYDYEKPIKAGGSVSFDFPAKLEGGFEIELHHGGGEVTIADLKVEPG
jgi:hypothetical protein